MDSSTSTSRRGSIMSRTQPSSQSQTGCLPPAMVPTCSIRAVWAGRVIFLLCLCAVTAILGVTAHYFLTESETELAEKQYDSIADRALDSAQAIMHRKRLGTITMASIAAYKDPDPEAWPFVTVNGYEVLASHLIETSSGRSMGFVPLVKPEELPAFEAFAYDFYQNTRSPPFPNGTATWDFGQGVWAFDPSRGYPDERYHDTDGSTSYDSPNRIATPVLQHNDGPHPVLLMNLHADKTRGTLIDKMLECADEHAGDLSIECGAITDIIFLTSQQEETGPGALIMQPIYPVNDPTKMTGLIVSSIVWDEVLYKVFAYGVSGVDCVLETENQVYTYSIINGVASEWAEGDLHDRVFDEYQRDISLTGMGLFSEFSANYTLTLYPTEELFEVYRTNNPMIATVGAVLIIFFTSLLFFIYDFLVRREFSAKKDLLEAKRQFIRFISHEVRTPLNTVGMGLALLEQELEAVMGCFPSSRQENNEEVKESNVKRPEQAVPVTPNCALTSKNISDWLDLTRTIAANTDSSVDVLNDVLNYDKIVMRTLNLERTIIPIWKTIQRTALEFKLAAAKKNINFVVDYTTSYNKESACSFADKQIPEDMDNCKVIGDVIRINQVVRNLISNALKFTPEGGKIITRSTWRIPKSRVRVNTTKSFTLANGEEISCTPNGYLELAVTDTGAGLSEEQIENMFRDGVQFNVNELQAGQGSGLGLCIAKGIVEQHGGSLTVASKGLKCGTTFTMTLPLFSVPDSTDKQDSDEYDEESSECTNYCKRPSHLHVLVVDDAPMNRKLVMRWLERNGHTCDAAENGLEAVDRVRESMKDGKYYESILLDYEMPVMNGPSAAQEMRKLGCDSFIVGITGNLLPEDVSYFKSCGANSVLPKPFRLPSLEELWAEYGVTNTE